MTIRKTWLAASVSAALFSLAAQAADETTSTAAAESSAQTQTLQNIIVSGVNRSTRTENKDTYTTSAMKTTTGLALSPKETPQSVSVITKTQLNDRGISSLKDAMKTTTGVNVLRESGRYRFQSRGFYVDQIEEDGIATTVAGSSGNPYRDAQSLYDMAIYDHVEVVRGATGLTQVNGEPGGTVNAVRKKPTAQTQIQGDLLVDRFGKARATLDVSGSLNASKTLRGRSVIVGERSRGFKDDDKGDLGLFYGVLEGHIGENTKVTAGLLHQRHTETPITLACP
ncbi:TonB-dependent siderophore receptor [Kingella oralis]|uniref:TonB-dependent receptor plug domain protein n=1 Tax=Kingella oralis ATCC 51147 TaxID=629741 RepID=C4GL83_9NEIS|nr:TonB-dependent receptor plug domain-containing protein [Kingella oralis]EEP67492.1 TonB-dependent receptor plug domain protein [Kingella oralis ATCC 51147]QMT43597.1 TonB-dependent receptor plug domain-containing protein [Kingella oralis]